MTMTVGARSLDNEERSNFRDYMSLLSLSVDASMTVREVMAVAYLIGRHDALRDVRNASSPARTVNRRLIHGGPSDCVFNRGYEAGAGMVSDEIDALMRDVEALSGDDAVFSMLRLDWLQCIRRSDEGRLTWDWRPTMADPKHPRHYEESFKRQIVRLYENGKPAREIRAEYDISHSTLHRWVQGIRNSGSTRATDNRTPERNEPVELRKRNRQLEMEVDVSEQAAPVFARRQA